MFEVVVLWVTERDFGGIRLQGVHDETTIRNPEQLYSGSKAF